MEAKQQKLTPREQEYLEHVQRAQERGETLVQYCRGLGLKVRTLYGIRRHLVRKGIVPRTLTPKKTAPGKFIAVRVAGSASAGGETLCRLRHPSGWVMECTSWPSAAWMTELVKGGADAAA